MNQPVPPPTANVATATPPTLDLQKATAFALKVIGDVTACQIGTLNLVADRLGLFLALAQAGAVTVEEFAERAGIHARYAREWLSAMACHGYVAFDNASKKFHLPPEHALALADPDSPLYLTSLFAMPTAYWANVDRLTDAFRHGGVPQECFGEGFWCGFERFTRTAFRNNLVQDWIPALPQVHARLQAGGRVADVGCGNGQALIFLAQAYPNAVCVGFDNYEPAITAANAHARAAGLPPERLRFEVGDVEHGLPDRYDLITCFDVVHDMPRPRPALKSIRESLQPGGTYFVLEFNFSSDLQENIAHPLGIGAFGYSVSTNYCMTQALAAGGEGTGTCLGETRMRAFAQAAGFTHCRRLDFAANPFNLFYELRA